MTTSRPRMARHRPWLVAAVASCAVLVPAVTAAATWQNSTITFIEFRDVCRDGIRFGGAIRADHGDTSPVFRDWAVASQPAPATWADRSTLVMRTRIGIPRAPYGATVPCVPTSATTTGSTCALSTTVDSLVPGSVKEGRRTLWQLGQVQVKDGGADGVVQSTGNTSFLRQGLFVP